MQHALANRNDVWQAIQKRGVSGLLGTSNKDTERCDSVEPYRLITIALGARSRSFLQSFFIS